MTKNAQRNTPPFYHGTRADLQVGDLLSGGYPSNFREEPLSWINFTQTLDAETSSGCPTRTKMERLQSFATGLHRKV
ncbi:MULTISPECIES: NAD(+)--rifampin ADP-ribosyltransferase [Rhizobium]|uniref:NAD(+)--rifampin ADP-ribosyltransferase n=1 Tax=Rhizobium TaxID=379 RepID=UPI00124F2015|nr:MULTISPECIES: NAD(+)--rifampin ADP-ribosyltransferase [Rhizobium]KAF5882160.1 NAD(+)--rifampin ADP-ribosyltransferase [Rhizobium sp. PEPV16]